MAERGRLGVHAVRSTDHQSRDFLACHPAGRRDHVIELVEDDVEGLDEEERKGGVDDIGRRQSIMDVATGLLGTLLGEVRDERDHVVVGGRFDLGDATRIDPYVVANGERRPHRHLPVFLPGLERR